jgi:phosphopantothenoylcysteine decarboxylase / phosphopantothenate---cysteine ligase
VSDEARWPELAGARVLLGVTGGIGAYKAAIVARLLVGAGAVVDPVLTRGAERFIGAATFEGITGRRARTEVWTDIPDETHVALGRAADLALIYPASAHTLARLAHGLADDLLTTTLLAATCPLVVAPAMHTEMWRHPATQDNITRLTERGVEVVGPADGPLMGGDVGPGRLVEPEDAVDRLATIRRRATAAGDLAGRTVVVTAGGTREPLDPVRYLGNRSSGKMGYAIAEAAADRGADVHLVSAPTGLAAPTGVKRHDVVTALEIELVPVSRIYAGGLFFGPELIDDAFDAWRARAARGAPRRGPGRQVRGAGDAHHRVPDTRRPGPPDLPAVAASQALRARQLTP